MKNSILILTLAIASLFQFLGCGTEAKVDEDAVNYTEQPDDDEVEDEGEE